jgi:alcohol dehydrogenase, propanol-preferring
VLIANARFTFPLQEGSDDVAVAPLLCAGLIGWRALDMAGEVSCLGIYGFGAAAHIITQVALVQQRELFAFTSLGDSATPAFARQLGVSWAGDSDQLAFVPLDAALIFAPVGSLVPQALRAVCKGGEAVCAGIHMSDIPSFPYRWLWEERQLRPVANLTRANSIELLKVAANAGIRTTTTPYALREANRALADLRAGRFEGQRP